MADRSKALSGAVLVAAACMAWSFSGMLSKWTPWGPFSIIGARALIAALAFGKLRGSYRVTLSAGNVLGALGVMLTSVTFITANKLTTAANAIVLQYAMPVVVILGSVLFLKYRPTKLDLTAAAVTMAGVALCFVSGMSGGNIVGDILALLSAVTFAAVFFAARLPGTNPMDYSYLGNALSCLCLFAIPFDPNFVLTWQSIVAALLLGVCLTAGYWLFSGGMASGVSPVTAAIVANIEPVLNPMWAFLVLGERPGLYTFLGAALVLCSVTGYSIINAKRLQRTAAAE